MKNLVISSANQETVTIEVSNRSLASLLEEVGVAYIGAPSQSMKLKLSEDAGWLSYGIYLAPWKLSGFNTCPGGEHCHESCLNGSGHGRVSAMSAESQGLDFAQSAINQTRIRKTRTFFQKRELFMEIVVREIARHKKAAARQGLGFCVRLNCTSDIHPERFLYKGRNLFQIFPDVQFYDYTKVPRRMELTDKYANYDLTFSFDGYNWDKCEEILKSGKNVAVVFAGGLPKSYDGFEVVDGNLWDMRFLDKKGCVVGLHYHPVANDFKNGTFVMPDTPFVVKPTDEKCVF